MIRVSISCCPLMNSFQIEVRHCIPNFEASLVADIFGLVNLWQNVALFIKFTMSIKGWRSQTHACCCLGNKQESCTLCFLGIIYTL